MMAKVMQNTKTYHEKYQIYPNFPKNVAFTQDFYLQGDNACMTANVRGQ